MGTPRNSAPGGSWGRESLAETPAAGAADAALEEGGGEDERGKSVGLNLFMRRQPRQTAHLAACVLGRATLSQIWYFLIFPVGSGRGGVSILEREVHCKVKMSQLGVHVHV